MLLTPIFTNIFTKLTGQDPKDFRFKQGNVPLSQLHEVVFGFALYLTVVFSIQHIMKKHNPIRLKWFNFLHNCILCVGSAILVTLFMEIIIPMIYHHGFYYSICNPAALIQLLVLKFFTILIIYSNGTNLWILFTLL